MRGVRRIDLTNFGQVVEAFSIEKAQRILGYAPAHTGATPEGRSTETPQSGDRRVAAKSHMTVTSAATNTPITSSALPVASSTSSFLRAGSTPNFSAEGHGRPDQDTHPRKRRGSARGPADTLDGIREWKAVERREHA
jgi:hypothetical protein